MKQLDALSWTPPPPSLRSLLGETEQATSAEEIAWAFRKLLEEEAPIACVFDDVQWGEETFLDLVEHVALLSRGAPILLFCLLRPGAARAASFQWPVDLRLEPLGEEYVEALITADARGKSARADRPLGRRNPLFVTEMVAIARESWGEVVVPPNLKSLLAARLDHARAG